MTEAPISNGPPAARKNGKRNRLLLIAGGAFVAIALAYGAWWFVYARHFEKTDDAYVQGNLVQITPQVAGTIVSVNADDTDFVKAGQTLVSLDRADAEVALDQAQASLGQTVREVRQLYTANTTWAANITQRQADIARAQSDVARAEEDLARRKDLTASGAVSGEELNHAEQAVSNARAALAAAQAAASAARQQLATNQSLTDGTTVEKHPKVREAYLSYARAVLPAPVSGYVAKRTAQVGQRVAPGAPLMAIIPLDQVWVDANFKEVQLRKMRIGQPVTLTADAYGNAVEYHGTLAGLGVGTGSAFALLPAQNATGNWIKVVQRIPVRIALDPKELAEHPLRVGLSMEVSVDVANSEGKTLASATRTAAAYTTAAFDRDSEDADVLVRKTIAANLGRPTQATAAADAPVAKVAPAASTAWPAGAPKVSTRAAVPLL
jgi:membrane fusion protein (multidrug efflux system)